MDWVLLHVAYYCIARGPQNNKKMFLLSRPAGAGCGTLVATLAVFGAVLVGAENISFVVLVPGDSDANEAYTPLTSSLKSVFRLAVEHVAEDDTLSQRDSVSLAVVESGEGTPAAASLCATIGANNSATYAVSGPTSLLGDAWCLFLFLCVVV